VRLPRPLCVADLHGATASISDRCSNQACDSISYLPNRTSVRVTDACAAQRSRVILFFAHKDATGMAC
jgi:hypothetical protein